MRAWGIGERGTGMRRNSCRLTGRFRVPFFQLLHFVRLLSERALVFGRGDGRLAPPLTSAASHKANKSANDSDRLSKYLARFGLKFRDL